MRIIEMHVTPIAVGDPPLLNAAGLHAPYALRTIIEIVTDAGITGLGEVPGSAETTAALEAAAEVIIGHDPFQHNAIYRGLIERFGAGNRPDNLVGWKHRQIVHVFSAVEVACFDIMGKATGRPVCDLLGGRARDRVDFSAYLFYKYEGAGGELGFGIDPAVNGWAAARQAAALDPAGIVAQAQAMCREFGFRSIKLKGGVFPPDEEVAAIYALREAFGPDTPLRLDPNAIWTVEAAITAGRKMEGVLEYYEDPVRGQEAMAAVRQAVKMPLATNMCTTAFEHLPRSIELGSEDIILSDHHFWGGLRASVELARICRTFGRGLSMHSNSHIGISLAAMTHLAAAVPNLTYACDTHYPWQSEEVILGGRLKFEDGALPAPTAPGLGIELDRAALAKLHENYLRCGLTRRDDELEMQKVQPGWRFEATRW
ncbi:MAG: glucarate dehydratase family protein [Anaerolineae bacterium]|jgi:glucarate dehydratase|nr:glucarate dehydratase family protein [Anaerolineae bacterium]